MWSDNETTQYSLGYQAHVHLLNKIVKKTTLPISIGIFGFFGGGGKVVSCFC